MNIINYTPLINEEFRPIKDFDRYMISNCGTLISRTKSTKKVEYRKIKTEIIHTGYESIRLYNGKNGSKRTGIHRLVAMTFLELPDNYEELQVNHIDGNKLNNNVNNLEWCTCKDNIEHGINTGLKESLKYNSQQIHNLCSILSTMDDFQYDYNELEQLTGINKTNISQIYNGRNWSEIAKNYKFKKIKVYSDGKGKEPEFIEDICKYIITHPEMNGAEVARVFDVTRTTVNRLKTCKTWKNITEKYFKK